MTRRSKTFMALLFVVGLMAHSGLHGADRGEFGTAPRNNNGKKWRIAYYQGGEYTDYRETLLAMVKSLMDLGWVERQEISAQRHNQKTRELWDWLAVDVKSNWIEFVKDAYYEANWDESLKKKVPSAMIERLNQRRDIDLVLAMGTWAGKGLANDKHTTPTMVLSTSDPVVAGIIKSIEDSGYDHIHARVDPLRYERQIRMFHEIVQFRSLGVIHENSDSGRVYAAADTLERLSKERGFQLVTCYSKDDTPDIRAAGESVIRCFEELAKKGVGALYVTKQNGVNKESIPDLVKLADLYDIPTFSQSGAQEVRQGFLMSVAAASFRHLGRYHAEVMAKIFNGAKPRDLDQVFESPPKIAINLGTAAAVGFDPPVDVLGAADDIFLEIEAP